MPTDTQKLRILRARTDHDLLVVIHRELERGLALLHGVTTRHSPLFTQAGKSLSTATALLARIASVGVEDRRRIEAKANELRARLDGVPAVATAWTYPAYFAS